VTSCYYVYDEFFQVPEWKNNWDLESARKACQSYLEESPAYEPCSTLTKVNTESILTSCVLNIRVISIHIFLIKFIERCVLLLYIDVFRRV
jgi:hypothetical protein